MGGTKPMIYPKIWEIKAAEREQLARWYRFLPSPGTRCIGESDELFHATLEAESAAMDLICERFKEMGMFDPDLSKRIGWEK
jgi:hypothetical protein